MHDQTNFIKRSLKKLRVPTKLEESNNIATMFAQYLHIFKLLI